MEARWSQEQVLNDLDSLLHTTYIGPLLIQPFPRKWYLVQISFPC